eukprot:6765275-Alexandrium_andersonii.AAC.1
MPVHFGAPLRQRHTVRGAERLGLHRNVGEHGRGSPDHDLYWEVDIEACAKQPSDTDDMREHGPGTEGMITLGHSMG